MSARPTPDSRGAYRHFRVFPTRWMDNDAYGHINNATYYSYFDTVVNRYLMDKGVLDWQHGPVIGFVVETRCNYFSPVSFPDTVHAGLRVAHLGTSSVRYEIGIFRNDDDVASAQGHYVHVYVARSNQRPITLPDDLRAALNKIRTTSSE
jgi:acyl-CoA thioester hydrolase